MFLVGAGPGDKELITLKGHNILQKADVILYDALVSPELIKNLTAEKIFVGKKKNVRYCTQDEINDLLVKFAKSGKVTVRLKGGDPLVFGRGGEEMAALIKNGVDFEIIPGLSSCTAVASSIGLPLTHRELSSSIAIITGQRKKGMDDIKIPKTDTIVFLMGLAVLGNIVDALIDKGYSEDSKIAVISKGTLKDERRVTGNLTEIVKLVRENDLTPPAVIVFGKVVDYYINLISTEDGQSCCSSTPAG